MMEDLALEYAKAHKIAFINRLLENVELTEEKTAIFMAGSPGAGKSEVANALGEIYHNIVLIDADEFRKQFPEYNGQNSSQFQKASSWLVEQSLKYMLEHGYSFILDATFAIESASKNIRRAFKNGYDEVVAYYVYQDPFIAWQFTKEREVIEGRAVPKSAFINAYFKSRANLKKMKAEYPNDLEINIVMKDYDNNIAEVHFDADNIDLLLPERYSQSTLEEGLK